MGMSSSSSKSTTSTTTNTSYVDESIAAQDSLVLGDGAGYQTGLANLSNVTGEVNLHIETLDGEVAKTAIDSATMVGLTALNGSADLVKTISAQYAAGQSELLMYSDAIIRQSGEQFAAAAAGESGRITDAISDSVKTGMIVAGVVAAAAAAAYIYKGAKK